MSGVGMPVARLDDAAPGQRSRRQADEKREDNMEKPHQISGKIRSWPPTSTGFRRENGANNFDRNSFWVVTASGNWIFGNDACMKDKLAARLEQIESHLTHVERQCDQ